MRMRFPVAAVALVVSAGSMALAAGPGWVADASKAPMPKEPLSGMIHGKPFSPKVIQLRVAGSVTLGDEKWTNYELVFRSHDDVFPETGVNVTFASRQGTKPDGKTFARVPGSKQPEAGPGLPHIQGMDCEWNRRKANGEDDSDSFRTFKGTVKVVLGARQGKQLPGSLYVCFDDPEKSFLAGTFTATIK